MATTITGETDIPDSWYSNILDFVIGSFGGIFDSIAGGIDSIGNALGGFFNSANSFFVQIKDVLNPSSDNFFLKKAFVPGDGFIDEKLSQTKAIVEFRFSWFNDLKLLVESLQMSDSTGGIESIKATLPIVGEVTIVDFQFVNAHAMWIRGLCSAFVYLLIAIYMIREAPKILGLMS